MLPTLPLVALLGFSANFGGRSSVSLSRSTKPVMAEDLSDLRAQLAQLEAQKATLAAPAPAAVEVPAAAAPVPAAAIETAVTPVAEAPAAVVQAAAPVAEPASMMPELDMSGIALPELAVPNFLASLADSATDFIEAEWLPLVATFTLLPTALFLGYVLLDAIGGLVRLVTGKKYEQAEFDLPPLAEPSEEGTTEEDAWRALATDSLDGEGSAWPAILAIKSQLEALPAAEQRRLKLEAGTNWPPRTTTVSDGTFFNNNREGFMFFQGPTPLTGTQEGLPSFFSGDNFNAVEVRTPLLIAGGVFSLAFAVVAGSLIIG